MLQQLIGLGIPFAVVFSNSPIGSDAFFAVLEGDRNQTELKGFVGSKQPLLVERPLSEQDIFDFKRTQKPGRWIKHDLGRDGSAYELTERPFRSYYQGIRPPKQRPR